MKRISLLLTCGSLVAGLHQAHAAAQLRLSDGTVAGTVTIVDDGAGDSLNTTPGAIAYIGPVGPNWTANVTVGTAYPNMGTPGNPIMDVGSHNGSADAGTLTIDFTQDGFTAGGPAAMSIGGTTVGTVTYSMYTDPANTPFAKTALIGTVGPLSPAVQNGSITGDTAGTVASATPYSITMEVVIQHPAGGGETGFDADLTVTPPACDCVLNFNSPSSITNCDGEAIPAVVATQVCGGVSSPAPVTVMGAATNGITCPKIITITNSATDGCGAAHTFVQKVTVNCKPDCTITPSVTVATVGGSNYTASVADAGVGASYSWTVMNGTITAGQDTPKITWSAGTDTSNLITIIVVVTSPAGCQSTCTASARLVPKPPPFGSGDTATIGFWHNKNGQGLINGAANSPALGNWLAMNFPCLFGGLLNQSNSVVAALFMTDFGVSGQKTEAQVMSVALASYFTDSNLGGGSGPGKFGFNNTPGGTGAKSFNVGSDGTALGLQNNTSYPIMQLLQAANAKCPFSSQPSSVVNAINDLFSNINQKGDIN